MKKYKVVYDRFSESNYLEKQEEVELEIEAEGIYELICDLSSRVLYEYQLNSIKSITLCLVE